MEIHSSSKTSRPLRWKVTAWFRIRPSFALTPDTVGLAVCVEPLQEMTDAEAVGREVMLPLENGSTARHVIANVIRDHGIQVLFFKNLLEIRLRIGEASTV